MEKFLVVTFVASFIGLISSCLIQLTMDISNKIIRPKPVTMKQLTFRRKFKRLVRYMMVVSGLLTLSSFCGVIILAGILAF